MSRSIPALHGQSRLTKRLIESFNGKDARYDHSIAPAEVRCGGYVAAIVDECVQQGTMTFVTMN